VREPGPVLEVEFLTELGHALSVAGDPVSSTEGTLRQVAAGLGLSDVVVSALPTLVMVRSHDGGTTVIDLAGAEPGDDLWLDQVAAVFDIVKLAQARKLTPEIIQNDLKFGDWTNRMTAPDTAQFECGPERFFGPIFAHFE
jgi:uncharacterized membrane protein YjjP (DUF1212 family)